MEEGGAGERAGVEVSRVALAGKEGKEVSGLRGMEGREGMWTEVERRRMEAGL